MEINMKRSGFRNACIAAIMLLLAACNAPPATPPPPATYPPRAIPIERPIVPPDVPMLDQNGKPATLSDLRGQYVFTFFGNVDCHEDCVEGVPMFARVKERLGEHDDIAYVMMGMDITADAPAILRDYLAKTDATFIGLTAEKPAMREFAVKFGIHTYYRKDGALAPHAPFMYLLDKEGRLIYFFQRSLSAEQIAETIKQVMKEAG
jgi:protein SCO1/2